MENLVKLFKDGLSKTPYEVDVDLTLFIKAFKDVVYYKPILEVKSVKREDETLTHKIGCMSSGNSHKIVFERKGNIPYATSETKPENLEESLKDEIKSFVKSFIFEGNSYYKLIPPSHFSKIKELFDYDKWEKEVIEYHNSDIK